MEYYLLTFLVGLSLGGAVSSFLGYRERKQLRREYSQLLQQYKQLVKHLHEEE